MASLVEQIFVQSGTGSAGGQGFGEYALRGAQLGQERQRMGQEQQRINLAEQQLAAQLALQPLKQTLLQQESKIGELKLTQLLEDRQATVNNESAFRDLTSFVGQSLRSGKVEEAEAAIWDAASRNRGLYRHQGFEKLVADTRASIAAKMQLQQLKNDGFAGPELRTVMDPNGNPITFAREGPNSWRPIQDNSIEVKTPDGTVVRQSTTRGGAANNGLQSAVVSDTEKRLAANDQSLALLTESIDLISPQTVGPVGAARELGEKVGNIVAPGAVPTDVTKARQTFRITAQQQYNALKADSQINKLEAEAMHSIADITKLSESDPTAREKYQTLRDLVALRSVLMSHELNKFAPDSALKAMSVGQVARAWKRGNLTDAEVERWNELNGLVK